MTFSGELLKNKMKLKITDGIVLIYKYEDKIKVHYRLTFSDGNKKKGRFFGEYNLFLTRLMHKEAHELMD
jgi:hypothetical protein